MPVAPATLQIFRRVRSDRDWRTRGCTPRLACNPLAASEEWETLVCSSIGNDLSLTALSSPCDPHPKMPPQSAHGGCFHGTEMHTARIENSCGFGSAVVRYRPGCRPRLADAVRPLHSPCPVARAATRSCRRPRARSAHRSMLERNDARAEG